ncbi:MAG: DUF4034 domain-containing protein [Gammaproteobacteria bacterium]|nr:DUF4034 domain-containing protein [Gammaproteobacteria bacterium]
MLRRLKISLFLSFLYALPYSYAETTYPDRLELLSQIENRQFEILEATLASYHDRYINGGDDERLLQFALETLANSNPDYEILISDWLQLQPDSFVPHLVRAYYYYGVAWSWRGHRQLEETSRARLEKMRNYLRLAAADISQAIELREDLSAADALALKVLMLLGEKEYQAKTLREALRIHPRSYLVRSAYIWSLKPEWGGRAEDLMSFIKTIDKDTSDQPLLKNLSGYADYIFAESLAEQKRYEDAAIHFDFAIDKGSDHIIYRERGINHYHLADYEAARRDFDTALALWPQDPKSLRWRSHALQRLGHNDIALGDIELASRLKPMNRYILKANALLSRKMKRFESVPDSYERALYYNRDDADIWYERGMHYSHELLNFEAALTDLKRATELSPDKPAYWYEYAAVLHYRLDCTITEPLEKYLALCNSGGSCRTGELKWARDAQDWLMQTERCSSG